jgi:hypothetical protein
MDLRLTMVVVVVSLFSHGDSKEQTVGDPVVGGASVWQLPDRVPEAKLGDSGRLSSWSGVQILLGES